MSMHDTTSLPSPADVVADALQTLEIDTIHSSESLAETRHWLANPGIDDPALVDWTSLPFVTMDNPDSRDLDQALLIERQENNGYRVRYALADAAYYVRPGTALFDDALDRGTTYYTPILAVPMLPVELSEGLVSLNPSVDRRALSFDMIVNEQATVTRTSIVRAKIHSQAKLNYAGVQAWLDTSSIASEPFHHSLLLLKELGNKLIDAAARRGVVRFNRIESEISVLDDPVQFAAEKRTRYQTERYNEQISLMCNIEGAEMLLAMTGVNDAIQAVFRVHDAPLRKSLGELRNTLDSFAERQQHPASWRWEPDQSLAEYVESLPDDPRNRRRVMAVQRQIMQAQRASSFTPEAGEHHALKVASYARFTSPMREIVGIFTHKELLEALGGHTFDKDIDSTLRERVIESANSSRQRQRKLEKMIEFAALSSVFARELSLPEPPSHTGTIMGLRGDRLYVGLDDLAVDVKLYRDDIQKQFDTNYVMSDIEALPENHQQPTWQLAQAVTLRVRGYDKERKRFLFALTSLDESA